MKMSFKMVGTMLVGRKLNRMLSLTPAQERLANMYIIQEEAHVKWMERVLTPRS